MLPKYRDILRHDADLDILIFSGDVDGIVPVIGTRRWVASLQLPIVKEWRPWYSHTGELCITNKQPWYDPFKAALEFGGAHIDAKDKGPPLYHGSRVFPFFSAADHAVEFSLLFQVDSRKNQRPHCWLMPVASTSAAQQPPSSAPYALHVTLSLSHVRMTCSKTMLIKA